MLDQLAPDDNKLREKIEQTLAGGLKTEIFPRADSQDETEAINARLRQAGDDLEQKLVIGGFTLYPVEHGGIEQPCETCMYYLVHRRFCELPLLNVPVEANWSCRLWRI
jgi:hypothetical protein